MGDGFGKVRMASPPFVDDLRTRDAEPIRDLAGPDELIGVELASH
jgi:hypothetical protein